MQAYSGNEAVARGAWEAGARFMGAYPGSPVTDIGVAFGRYSGVRARWLANEKVALEATAGAAYAGARALAVMKHVGLNVAADALFNLAYTGVEGGLVIAVGDDPGARSSQNEQDTRQLAAAANVPVLDPADVQEAYAFTRLGFSLSERFDLPVIVRLTTQLCYSTGELVTAACVDARRPAGFAGPVQKYLLLPKHVLPRHRALLASLDRLGRDSWSRFFYQAEFPQDDDGSRRYPIGLVCNGYPSSMVKETLGERMPLLRVGMSHPLHAGALRAFAGRCERLLVVEECSPFLEQRIRALGLPVVERGGQGPVGEFKLAPLLAEVAPDLAARSPAPVAVPLVPSVEGRLDVTAPPNRAPGFCAGCPHVGPFVALSKRQLYVVGDIGCYTLGAKAPFNALHSNLCMGASLGVLQGYLAVLGRDAGRRAVAVIGDSTFFHSGLPSLLSAVRENPPGTILILDNSGSAMTGLQETGPCLSAEQWERLLDGLGVREREVVPSLDMERLEAVLDRFLASDNLSVLVVKGTCVQSLPPRRRASRYRYAVVADRCTGCEACFKSDCPAITWGPDGHGGRQVTIGIDCIGCGLCAQLCPERAILPLVLASGPRWLTGMLAQVPWPALFRSARAVPPIRRLIERLARESA